MRRGAVLVMVAVAATVLVGGPAAANHDHDPLQIPPLIEDTTHQQPAPEQVVGPDQGVGGMFQSPDLRDGHQPTAYERYGVGSLTVRTDLGNLPNPVDVVLNAVTAVVWALVQMLVAAVTAAAGWVFSADLLDPVSGGLADAIDGIATIYWMLLGTVIVAIGAWAGWQAFAHQRASLAIEGLASSVIILGLSIAFLAQPVRAVQAVHEVSNELSQAVLSTAGQAVPDRPAGRVVADNSTIGTGGTQQLRAMQDSIYRTLALQPWAILNFGSLDAAAEDNRAQQLLDRTDDTTYANLADQAQGGDLDEVNRGGSRRGHHGCEGDHDACTEEVPRGAEAASGPSGRRGRAVRRDRAGR